MHLKVSSSHDETVEMVWRLRSMWARVARLITGPAGPETLDGLSDERLAERGLERREIMRVVAGEKPLPNEQRSETATGLSAIADPFEGRTPFARRRPHLVVVKSGRAPTANDVPSHNRTHNAA